MDWIGYELMFIISKLTQNKIRFHFRTSVVLSCHRERNLSFLLPVRLCCLFPDTSETLFCVGIFIELATEANEAIRILSNILSVFLFWMDFSGDSIILTDFSDGDILVECRCLWNNEKNVPDPGEATAYKYLRFKLDIYLKSTKI